MIVWGGRDKSSCQALAVRETWSGGAVCDRLRMSLLFLRTCSPRTRSQALAGLRQWPGPCPPTALQTHTPLTMLPCCTHPGAWPSPSLLTQLPFLTAGVPSYRNPAATVPAPRSDSSSPYSSAQHPGVIQVHRQPHATLSHQQERDSLICPLNGWCLPQGWQVCVQGRGRSPGLPMPPLDHT